MLRGKAIVLKRALAAVSVMFFMLIAIVLTALGGITFNVDLSEHSVSAYEISNTESGRTVRIAVNSDVQINTSQQLCNYFNTGDKEVEYSGTEEATAQIIDGIVTLRAGTTIIFFRGEDTDNDTLNAVNFNYSSLESDIILDGNNSVIRCENLGVDESGFYGAVADNIRLFNFIGNNSKGNFVTLKNLTLRGGIINASGASICADVNRLDLENVTIRDCKSQSGGGICIYRGVVYAKNCFFIRNIAEYGGGFLVRSLGKIYMENSVCSENRSTRNSGGGGAGEVQGELYLNNCTFSNNISTEYGGALNVYGGHVYALNSTFTGNVTTNRGLTYGGAIGIHGGSVTLINSLLMYNYAYDSQEKKLGISDIGGNGDVTMYGCVYSGLGGLDGLTTDKQEGNCQIDIETVEVFTSFSSNQIYKADGTLFSAEWVTRPLLVNNGITSVVPLNETANAANNGEIAVKTSVNQDFSHAAYFDPTTEQWTAVVGEFSDSYTVKEAEKDFVRIYQDGTARDLKVVGAYGAEGGPYYSVQVIETKGVIIKGASYYGEIYDASKDNYPEGRDVTVEAIGANINAWQISANNGESETIAKGTTGTVYTNVSISADGLILTIDNISANYVVKPIMNALFTVKFVYDKKTNIPEQVFYAKNRLATKPNVSVTGYTIEGWYTDESFTHMYDFKTPVNESLTLYGKDKPKTITIRLIGNKPPAEASGSITCSNGTVYGQYQNSTIYLEEELKTVVAPTAALKGWVFEGWFFSGGSKIIDSEGKLVNDVPRYTNEKGELITSSTSFYAYPRFTPESRKLTLNAGEGQIAVAEVYAPYDGTILFTDEAMGTEITPADIIPSNSTLIFTGYFTASTGGKTIINNEGKLVTKLRFDEDATLYAQYADGKEAEYSVEYYHQNLDNDEYTCVFSKTYRGAGLVTVQPEVTRGEDGEYLYNEEMSVISGTIKEDGNLTLKIYYDLKIIELKYSYIQDYFLSFEGAERFDDYTLIQRVKYGSAISPPTLVAQDYICFYGYSDSYSSISMPEKALKNTTFRLAYSWMYSIEYILNDGINALENPTKYVVNDGATVKNPTKTGCDFVGWRVNGSEPIKDLTLKSEIYFSDIKLEAVWEYILYTVNVSITEGGNCGEVIITPSKDCFIYQERVKVVISPNAGYTVILDGATVDIAEDGTFIMPADNVVIGVRIIPIEVEYKVIVYKQNIEGDGYVSEENTYSKFTGTVVNVDIPEHKGFKLIEEKSTLSGAVAGDGSSMFEIYLDRLTYSIVWKNDVQVLQIKYLRYGAKPIYDGVKPEKAETDVCSYEFIGWDREILPVNANEIYFAKFNRIVKAVDSKPSAENEVKAEITFEKQVVAEENDVITLVVSVLPEEKITVPQYLEIIETYEAKLFINGVDISEMPEGEMKITISAPKELTGRKNVTIVMADANGNTVSKTAVIEGGYIIFTTDILGDFAIAADWEMPNSFFILLGLLLLIILAIIIFIVSQIFNNRKI